MNVEIVPITAADAETMAALVDANRAHIARWMPWAETGSRTDTIRYCEQAGAARSEGREYSFAIRLDGRTCGAAGLNRIDRDNRSANLGYWIAAKDQGRGAVTAAVRDVLRFAFDDVQLNRIEIRASTENTRSRAIPERLGFRHEGRLVEAERFGAGYRDLESYALLARERERAGI